MRRLLLSLALALTLSAVGASSALAEAPEGAQKAPLYGPHATPSCDIGAEPTPKTFGSVVLNTPGDETTLTGEVALKGAKPNTEYEVGIAELSPAICFTDEVATITTNKKGNGNFHLNVERRFGLTTFFAFVVNSTEEFASPAVQLE
jgi:hypothetical protein